MAGASVALGARLCGCRDDLSSDSGDFSSRDRRPVGSRGSVGREADARRLEFGPYLAGRSQWAPRASALSSSPAAVRRRGEDRERSRARVGQGQRPYAQRRCVGCDDRGHATRLAATRSRWRRCQSAAVAVGADATVVGMGSSFPRRGRPGHGGSPVSCGRDPVHLRWGIPHTPTVVDRRRACLPPLNWCNPRVRCDAPAASLGGDARNAPHSGRRSISPLRAGACCARA